VNVTLPRLEKVAVRSMVGDMLAWLEPSEDFVRFVIAESEGNPFFVAEWLRAAVGQGILHRDHKHMWQLVGGTHDGRDYGTLPLPRSLRALIEHRLKDLSTPARETVWATAVLGRSASRDLIRQVAGLGDDPSADAFDELLRRHVFEQSEISDVRFAHDKLREVSYAQAPTDVVVEMHARAGAALERQWSSHPDASQVWPTLGHHFAVARRHDRAAKYLRLAAQHASSTYANGEAIVLCQEAINEVKRSLAGGTHQRLEAARDLAELHELLGDLLHLTGRRAEARDPYQAALLEIGDASAHHRARLFRKMGKGWEMDHEYQTALANYSRAEEALPSSLDGAGAAEINEWINVMIDQLWVHYWLNQVPEMNRISQRLRPVVERHGSPSQTGRFFDTQMKRNLRFDRFSIREETLEYARAAVRACEVPEGLADLPMQKFNLGFTLLFQRSWAAANRELAAGLALSERSGDIGVQVRCLTYLAVGARMQRDVSETRRRNQAAAEGARVGKMQEYVAAARANESWICLREGRLEEARAHAESALATWAKLALVFPFQWLAALPLLEVSLQAADLDRAGASAALLISGTQQWLPGPAMDALARGLAEFNRGDALAARAAFEHALLTLNESEFH
jgi:tetratricopeptide (TPR) repeat protein